MYREYKDKYSYFMIVNKKEQREKMEKEFRKKFDLMLDLAAKGRGIEILLRIIYQTKKGLERTDTYQKMQKASPLLNNAHPKCIINDIIEKEDKEKIELARDIADKLAHALYYQARIRIDKYVHKYSLKNELNSKQYEGFRIDADGHVIESDGRKLKTLVYKMSSSKRNTIYEEFNVFIHNNYHSVAYKIFQDAQIICNNTLNTIATKVVLLDALREMQMGEKTYTDD